MKSLGLIAGQGEMPRAIALEAKRQGYRVVVAALRGLADESIVHHADATEWFKAGKLGAIINFLKAQGAGEVLFAGKFPKDLIVRGALSPDPRLLRFLFRLRDRGDDTILNSVAGELSRDGIRLLDMRDFCRGMLAPEGPLTRRKPTKDEWGDIIYGFRIAKGVGRLEIGQTVVVKDRAVMAVEAVEGTDETILRGGGLAGGGAVVVKVSRPDQDMRMDLPVVGLATLDSMVRAEVRALALEAGSSIIIERDELVRKADEAGIAIAGVTEASLKERD
jgi:DUF1009 family protein